MYCVHCGKEINEGSKFCPYCGKPQSAGENPNIDDMIDKVGNEIGSGLDEAVGDLKDGLKNSSETISKTMEKASQQAEEVKKNWKDYLTFENMELLAALVLALPLFMGVVNFAVSFVFGIFSRVPVVGFILGIVPFLVRLLFILVAAAGVAAIVYLLVKNPVKRNLWSFITAGGTVLAFFACLGIAFGWKGVPIVFGLLCLIYGVDCISRVLLQKKGVEDIPEVGKDLNAYKAWYEDYKANHPVEETPASEGTTAVAVVPGSSYFDGSGLTLFGLTLLTGLVSGITCGLAAPWMICKLLRWRKSHTVIDGRRLAFNGTGGSLFGHWILWEILTVITCGIYSFFLHVALKRWEMQHTTYEDAPNEAGQFDGNSFQYFGYGLLQMLLLTVTCGLAAPWTITMIQKWEMKHAIVRTDRMKYEGTALGLLGQYIIVFLLSAITCGIYSSWGIVRINKYVYSHTHVDHTAQV